MFAILAALAAAEIAVHIGLQQDWFVIGAMLLWGMAAFATAPGLQTRVLVKAHDAPALASTLNIAAFNLGNAAAAWLRGLAWRGGLDLSWLPVLSACQALAALCLLAVMELSHRSSGTRLLMQLSAYRPPA